VQTAKFESLKVFCSLSSPYLPTQDSRQELFENAMETLADAIASTQATCIEMLEDEDII